MAGINCGIGPVVVPLTNFFAVDTIGIANTGVFSVRTNSRWRTRSNRSVWFRCRRGVCLHRRAGTKTLSKILPFANLMLVVGTSTAGSFGIFSLAAAAHFILSALANISCFCFTHFFSFIGNIFACASR